MMGRWPGGTRYDSPALTVFFEPSLNSRPISPDSRYPKWVAGHHSGCPHKQGNERRITGGGGGYSRVRASLGAYAFAIRVLGQHGRRSLDPIKTWLDCHLHELFALVLVYPHLGLVKLLARRVGREGSSAEECHCASVGHGLLVGRRVRTGACSPLSLRCCATLRSPCGWGDMCENSRANRARAG